MDPQTDVETRAVKLLSTSVYHRGQIQDLLWGQRTPMLASRAVDALMYLGTDEWEPGAHSAEYDRVYPFVWVAICRHSRADFSGLEGSGPKTTACIEAALHALGLSFGMSEKHPLVLKARARLGDDRVVYESIRSSSTPTQ